MARDVHKKPAKERKNHSDQEQLFELSTDTWEDYIRWMENSKKTVGHQVGTGNLI